MMSAKIRSEKKAYSRQGKKEGTKTQRQERNMADLKN